MSLMRTVFLKASESVWLRERATRARFVRRAVSRFMPGETFDDMVGAARSMAGQGVQAVFTRLGENVKDLSEAEFVARHYLEGVDRIQALALDCEPSIKLTQLGLDINPDLAFGHARAICQRAHAAGSYVWVDIEQSHYVDVTLDIVRRLGADFARVGVCLQAYLYRTRDDLEDITRRGIGVRLVKGAYKEPPEIAFPKKTDVDANYLALAKTMLGPEAAAARSRPVFGTHDTRLIAAIQAHASAAGVAPSAFEFHMLYGIQKGEQLRLAREGASARVLIAYGSYWFPWYMRRLAERPANVWFVARSLFR